jgi:hypothetical protein
MRQHGLQLGGISLAPDIGHGGKPQRGMADERRHVHPRDNVGERARIVGEGRELVCGLRAEQVHRRGRLAGKRHRGEADAASCR